MQIFSRCIICIGISLLSSYKNSEDYLGGIEILFPSKRTQLLDCVTSVHNKEMMPTRMKKPNFVLNPLPLETEKHAEHYLGKNVEPSGKWCLRMELVQ